MIKTVTAWTGRVMISLIFVMAGIHKVSNWQASEFDVIKHITRWHMKTSHIPGLESFFDGLIPYTSAILGLVILLELAGGIMLLLSYRVRTGALLLVFFLIPVTIIAHSFWMMDDASSYALQQVMFFKNIAILGGLLQILVFGKGSRQQS